jgi:superoxide dismutase, Cu-Zn family
LKKARRPDTRPTFLVTVAFAALAAAPLMLSGCETGEPRGGAPMPLIGANGQTIGQVRAWQTAGGVTFRIDATGLPHGVHGIHVHTVGRCDPPGFESAGAHWNPATKHHGFDNPAGPHAGDLRNVEVAANGTLGATVTLAGASLTGPGPSGVLLDQDGAALVLHAAADDYVTDPSGNSGARIACAVLQPVAEVR